MNVHSKRTVNAHYSITTEVLVQGRAMVTWCTYLGKSTGIFNCHNWGWSSDELATTCEWLRSECRTAQSSNGSYHLLLLGDFNFSDESKPGCRPPQYEADPEVGKAARKQHAKLRDACSSFTLLSHDSHTHYNSAEEILTDIDLVFSSLPGWQLQHVTTKISILPPLEVWSKGLSDHGIVSLALGPRPNTSKNHLPIPKWVTTHPRFAFVLQRLVHKEDLGKLTLPLRLSHYETLIREAARLCRNEISKAKRELPEMKLQNLITCGRIVTTNNVQLAKKLVDESDFYFARIRVAEDKVLLIDPCNFNAEYATSKRESFQISSEEDCTKPTNLKHKVQAGTRLAMLWRSKFPTLSLKAIKRTDGIFVSKAVDIANEMVSSWFNVFGIARSPAPGVAAFLGTVPAWSGASRTAPPSKLNISHVIEELARKQTACGPNGIPYHAWAALLELSSQILFDVNLHIFEHGFANLQFNEQICVFIPKASCADQHPTALETRPLGLKNSAPKILASANSRAFNKVVLKKCSKIQRGVAGRNFAQMSLN